MRKGNKMDIGPEIEQSHNLIQTHYNVHFREIVTHFRTSNPELDTVFFRSGNYLLRKNQPKVDDEA